MRREDEKEDVSSYCMMLKKRKEKMLEIESVSIGTHCAECLLWERLWFCR